jgi:hypothetical protein
LEKKSKKKKKNSNEEKKVQNYTGTPMSEYTEDKETWDEKLTDCPDCDSHIIYCQHKRERDSRIKCADGCGFKGFEDYRFVCTVREATGGKQ